VHLVGFYYNNTPQAC